MFIKQLTNHGPLSPTRLFHESLCQLLYLETEYREDVNEEGLLGGSILPNGSGLGENVQEIISNTATTFSFLVGTFYEPIKF